MSKERASEKQKKLNWELVCAVENRNLDEIKSLISQGVNIHERDESGESLLHRACRNEGKGAFETVKFLVEQGADIHEQDGQKEEWTPLHESCLNNGIDAFEIVKFLVEQGADINLENSDHETSLYEACCNANNVESIVPFLLDHIDIVKIKDLKEIIELYKEKESFWKPILFKAIKKLDNKAFEEALDKGVITSDEQAIIEECSKLFRSKKPINNIVKSELPNNDYVSTAEEDQDDVDVAGKNIEEDL